MGTGTRRAILVLLLWASASPAQSLSAGTADELRRRIAALEQQLQTQQEELQELKARLQQEPDAGEPVSPIAHPPAPDVASRPQTTSSGTESPKPMDVNGYFSSRFFDDTRPDVHSRFQAHVVSVFLGKTLGKWKFFSEIEFEYAPNFSADGATFTTSRGELLLETAWLNYAHRDWLNARAGFLFVPTYWREHHYPSVALTVTNPLIDQKIFPAAITGVMAHGSRYFEDGGLSYALFLGNGRGRDFARQDVNDHKATGGKLLVHVPNRHFFDTFDLGVLTYRDKLQDGDMENIHGFEARIEKGPVGVLAEFAHSATGPPSGSRRFFREGFYVQPWMRVWRQLHLVYRYDTLNFDSRSRHTLDARQHTVGINYRPLPTVSLKLEFDRQEPAGANRPVYHGIAAGVAFFLQ